MALADGRLYLLPDDGAEGVARLYVFDLARLHSMKQFPILTAGSDGDRIYGGAGIY